MQAYVCMMQCAQADPQDKLVAVAKVGSHLETSQTSPNFQHLNILLQVSPLLQFWHLTEETASLTCKL